MTKPVLGLTLGDPAGIGPEICLRALLDPAVLELCVPVLFGDAAVLRRLEPLPCFASLPFPGAGLQTISPAEFKKLGRIVHPLLVDCAAIDAAALVLK